MGAAEIQIFVSLLVVLGTAGVALLCDFLKGRNEQLREANIELRVRQLEREQRAARPERDEPAALAVEEPSNVVHVRVLTDDNLIEMPAPCGSHTPVRLPTRLADETSFHGLVVAIGCRHQPADFEELLIALTYEPGCACRISENEFLLLFTGETGATAKRRTRLVAESLWKFQLSRLGGGQPIFGWGAEVSSGAPLARATAMARQRLSEALEERHLRRNTAKSAAVSA